MEPIKLIIIFTFKHFLVHPSLYTVQYCWSVPFVLPRILLKYLKIFNLGIGQHWLVIRDCWQCNHHHSALDILQKANPFPLSPLLSFSPVFLLPSFSTVSPISSFLYSLFNFSFSILFSLSPFLAQSVSVLSCFLFLLFSTFPLLSNFSSFPSFLLSPSLPSFFSPSLCLCYHLSQFSPYFIFSLVSFSLSSPLFFSPPLFLISSWLSPSSFPLSPFSLYFLCSS